MWYVLAAANAVTDADLVAGTTLRAPQVTTTANDASTFKPYDPNAILGPTTPSLPYISPPPQSQCNAVAQILMVVVAIIVTVYTAGAAASALAPGVATATGATSTMAVGGAVLTGTAVGSATTLTTLGSMVVGGIAGAAGAASSMAVGSAMGVASFNWRGVAAGAVTGGLTAGLASHFGTLGAAANVGNWGKVAGLAIANASANAIGQVVGGGSFSWRSVAANAVSNVLSAGISKGIGLVPGDAFKSAGGFGPDLANGMIGGVVSLHARRAFGFDDAINYGNIAADAFGNALGNVAVAEIDAAMIANRARKAFSQLSPEQQLAMLPIHLNDPNAASDGKSRLVIGGDADELEEMRNTVRAMQAQDQLGSDSQAALGVNGHTRSVTDADMNLIQADIDALRAQGRDMTTAQQALEELWTRGYVSHDIAPIDIVGGTPQPGSNLADASLLWLGDQFQSLRAISRANIDNASSAPEALIASGVYAINEVSSAVGSGVIEASRLLTSSQQRRQFSDGMQVLFTTNPVTTANNAWRAWNMLPAGERLRAGAATIATLGVAPLARGKNLADAANSVDYLRSSGRIARYEAHLQRLSQSVSVRTEALAEFAGRVEMLKRGYVLAGDGKLVGNIAKPGAGRGSHGIDRVYRSLDNPNSFALLESKYRAQFSGTSPLGLLGDTNYGKQMSTQWVDRKIDQMMFGPHGMRVNQLGTDLFLNGYQGRYMNVINQQGAGYFYDLQRLGLQ